MYQADHHDHDHDDPQADAADPVPGSAFYGMSNAMAFGLGVGTILTLGVVPVLYAMLFRVPGAG